MPAVTELRTPPATQANVIALYAQGTSKRKIARELSIDKNTVDSIIRAYGQDQASSVNRVKQLVPIAYDALEKGLKSGDAKLGLDFLKVTDLSEQAHGPTYTIHADQVLMAGHSLLPSAANASANPVRPQLADSIEVASVAVGSAPTEAPAKAPPSEIGLSCDTNFLENTDSSELIRVLESRGFRIAAPTPAVPHAQ
jgi:Homeodomain-like domain